MTLELWTDFQCPICGQFARTVEPALVSKYVTPGTLRIVHHDAAFQGAKSDAAYDESVEPAAGARCAAIQGRYWPFQDWTFANQYGENRGAFAAERLTAIATAAGLDIGGWQACVATGDQPEGRPWPRRVRRSRRAWTATPTMRINGQVSSDCGASPTSARLIDAAAAAAADPAMRATLRSRGRLGLRDHGCLAVLGLAIVYLLAGPACWARRRHAVRSRAARPSRRASTRRSSGIPVALFGVGFSVVLAAASPRLVAARRSAGALSRLRAGSRGDHRRGLPDLPRAVRDRGDLRLVRRLRRDHRRRMGMRRDGRWRTSGRPVAAA